jgi:hypothetical protein
MERIEGVEGKCDRRKTEDTKPDETDRRKTNKLPGFYVRFEVFTAVTTKNGVFWDVTPCGSCKNRRFGGTWRLLHQGDKNR